nr:hypothetical protein [Tanacetum cinerariifolium]
MQTCELSKEEFNYFLALYLIPPTYHVILPKSNQTVFDAPPRYVRLYTHSFSLANLKLPLTEFFCEVLEYFQVYISRLNPFGYAKLTTFVVMCKAYGREPTVELFWGFFNLCRAGKWLTVAKRTEKHITHLFLKVITRIEGWKERFLVVHYASGLSFLTAICLIRQRLLKKISHSDLGNKPLPISFLGSVLVFLLHSGLPLSFCNSLAVRLRSGLPSMGMIRKTLAEGEEGGLHLGPERPRVYYDLSPEDKERMQLNSKFINKMLPEWGRFVSAVKLNRGLKESNYDQPYAYLKQHEGHQNRGQGNNAKGTGAAATGGAQNRAGNVNPCHTRQIKCYNYNGGHENTVDEDVDEPLVQDLALNVDNEFQDDKRDAFNYDVDDAPTAQTMFMANLSFTYHVYDKAGPSYDSDILSEVHDHDYYQGAICENHDVHEMHDDVQPNCAVGSGAEYTGDSNMITYDQYVNDNAEPIVQNIVSYVPNDAPMMILNEMHEQTAQCVSVKAHTKDVQKIKAKALKEQTKALKPIKALTLYPPNTLTKLVPRVLPTKSQVKINIFAPIQLFLEFVKTCEKKITPTGLTEGERGFEQTYLTEVIPFFKTLKEHFEGIQKALTKEIKEMKEIFEVLEVELDQNVLHKKCDEIKEKNLLITNDNLITDCLSKEVFYIATNSELTVSRFTKMHDAHAVVQARCLELKAELSKLNDKIQKDGHNEFVKHFSNLEITQLAKKVTVLHEQKELFRVENAKIKQHHKELNNKEVHLDYLKPLQESVATLHEIIEEARAKRPLDRSLASTCLYTKHSQELLEYVVDTCPKDFSKRDKIQATTPLNRKKQVTFEN